MNKHNDKLLGELLTGEEVANFRRDSLDQILCAVRGRKRQRRAAAMGFGMIGLGVVGALLLLNAGPPPRQSRPARSISQQSVPTAHVPAEIETITDQELLELLPGRTVAIVGSPGHQRLLVFE